MTHMGVDCRDGRIRQTIGVRQHRWHDPTIRIVEEAYQEYTETHSGGEERGCRRVEGGQGERYAVA